MKHNILITIIMFYALTPCWTLQNRLYRVPFQYLLTGLSGRILQIKNVEDSRSPSQFNLKKLPAGSYIIIAKTQIEEKVSTFVKR